MSSGARLALFGLIGVLLVILAVLILFAFVIRRRSAADRPTNASPEPVDDASVIESIPEGQVLLRTSSSATSAAGAALGNLSGAVEAVGSTELVACPTCRREYETKLQYCPHDARRLVPASEILDSARKNGSICPRCHRAYDPGMRYCPHDATELIPSPLYQATKGRKATAKPTGVVAKICPRCNSRHDLSETFCGKDGAELVIIN